MSSGALVLPAVNRNFPRAVSQSISGLIAYASRYHIYFVDARCNPPLLLDSKFISSAHKGKIIALSFSKYEEKELIASLGDDLQLKVWDVDYSSCVISTEVKEISRLAEWLFGSSNILFYQVDPKHVAKWNVDTNTYVKLRTGSEIPVTVLLSNEKSPNLLAVGHNNGQIAILDVVQERPLYKLRAHTNEISSLSWSSLSPDTLLSGSLDFSLRVWKMGEDKPAWTHYFPTTRQKMDDRKKIRILGTWHPSNPNAIISVNLRGDIGEITYVENEKPRFTPYAALSCDGNAKFAFAFFTFPGEDEQTGKTLCCFDIYRVSVWSITDKKFVYQVPMMMGFAYDLTNSAVNPNLLAIGNGDGILKIYNSQAEATKTDMISVYVHYRTKIMTVAFHPTVESLLAYGTDEGRVGIIDIFKKKVIYTFETHHSETVYSLCWGPCEKAPKSDDDAEYFIYSSGGGLLYINRENAPKTPALNFDDLVERPADLETIEKCVSEVTWKPDFSCLCIGSYKGFIDIYSDKFLFLTRYNVQMKSVECLRWHPESTYMSPGGSSLKCWFACCGNDMDIHVFDSSSIFEPEGDKNLSVAKKLISHKKKVVSVSWSQHNDGYLASASRDGTALVWNVCAGTIIATYSGHQDVVYTVQWSVFDQDVIYSGGQDSSVRVWKISEQNVIIPPDKAPRRKKLKKPRQMFGKFRANDKSPSTENKSVENGSAIAENGFSDNKISSDAIADEAITSKDSTTSIEEKVQAVPGHLSNKALSALKRSSGLCSRFPIASVFTKEEELNDCMKLANILCVSQSQELSCSNGSPEGIMSNEDLLKFSPFADRITALSMFETQGYNYKSEGETVSACEQALRAGKLKTFLSDAAEMKSLNAYLVSMAPAVSYEFWLQMCEKYAVQLIEEHHYYKASNFYLMCNKTYEAISVLAEKTSIVEALALAKARLPDSDQFIRKLIIATRKKYSSLANTYGETKCYLASGEPLRAAKTLAALSDLNSLKAAAHICKKFDLKEEANEYLLLCMDKCLIACDWSFFKALSIEEPNMHVYNALFTVHEVLYHHIRHFKKFDGILVREIFSVRDSVDEVKFWKGNTCISTEQSFIDHVYHLLLSEKVLNLEESALQDMLQALETMSIKRKTFESSADVHIAVAISITKFILLCLLKNFEAASTIFLKIFQASHDVVFLPKILWFLFFPTSLYCNINKSNMICKSIITKDPESKESYVTTQFHDISESLCTKIMSYTNKTIKSDVICKESLLRNRKYFVLRIGHILSTKEMEDYLLAYFASSICNDLMRLVEKKDFKIECHADVNNDIPSPEPNIPATEMCDTADTRTTENKAEDGISETSPENDSLEMPVKEENRAELREEILNGSFSLSYGENSSVSVQELIRHVLMEAEEKARSFVEEMGDSEIINHVNTCHSSETASTPDKFEDASDCFANQTDVLLESKSQYEEVVLSENTEDHLNSKEVLVPQNEVCTNVNISESSDSHAQCLRNIDLFYNITSFIALNVCKDEFALLYYLKEYLRVLNATRATKELIRFSKENKVEFSDPSSNTVPGEIPEIVYSSGGEKSLVVEEEKECNGEVIESESLKLIETGDMNDTEGTIKEDTELDCDSSETVDSLEGEKSLVAEEEKESNGELSASENLKPTETYLNNTEGTIKADTDLDCDLKPKNGFDHQNSSYSSVSDGVCNNSSEVHLQQIELTHVSNDHNYATQKTDTEMADTAYFPNGHDDDSCKDYESASPSGSAVFLLPLQDDPDNLSKEISGIIQELEMIIPELSYPSPFVVIPKILQILYDVVLKSSCSVIQDKLHKLIDEIILWTDTFSVGEINFVCKLCHKASGV